MIKITHECWNTRRRTTYLYCTESSFSGTGIPLQVILHSFCKKDIVWFSAIYGEWDDNVLLLGLNREKSEHLEKEKYEIDSPISKNFGVGNAFEEYILSSKVQQELGVSLGLDDTSYSISREEEIQYQIYCHDDCMPYVGPIDKDLLRNLVDSVLQQHSYYLQTEVDWSSVLDNVIQELVKSTCIKIKSRPANKSLSIRSETCNLEHFWAFWDDIKNLLFPRTKCTILIKDGKAILV